MKLLLKICFALGTVLLFQSQTQAQCAQPFNVQMIVSTFNICQGHGSICALVVQPGVGPYHFKWSNGYKSTSSAESCAQNLVPDQYEVTMYDLGQPGCEKTFGAEVPVPTEKDCPEREERRERDERDRN